MKAPPSLVGRVGDRVRQFGIANTLSDIALRAGNRLAYFRILKAVRIHEAKPPLEERPEYVYAFLSRPQLLAFSACPQYEMPSDFLQEALDKGDECYGVVHGAVLASYGWYSNKPTAAVTDDLMLCFDPAYVYMYKGFTHEAYRGQRLHAAGMAHALQAYRARGFKGLVSYVESNNFRSLRSCYRMGHESFGHIILLRAFGRYFMHASTGCREVGFELTARNGKSFVTDVRSAAKGEDCEVPEMPPIRRVGKGRATR